MESYSEEEEVDKDLVRMDEIIRTLENITIFGRR